MVIITMVVNTTGQRLNESAAISSTRETGFFVICFFFSQVETKTREWRNLHFSCGFSGLPQQLKLSALHQARIERSELVL